MPKAPFYIYNASAGSGKTYSLVLNFLKLCLRNKQSDFKSILAITFTNKAAGEMKERIINALKSFAAYPESGKEKGMFEEIAKEYKLSEDELKERSYNLLRQMLHQYSALSVSTIDKFTNRLIRSFANDLNLSSTYEVELQSNLILNEAIDLMLYELKEDSTQAEVLINFLNSQLEEGKSPRTEHRLLDIAKALFEERAFSAVDKIKNLPPSEFLEIRNNLIKRNKEIKEGISKMCSSFFAITEAHSIEDGFFTRGSLPNYLRRLMNGDFISPSDAVVKSMLGEDSFYPKSKVKIAAHLFDAAGNSLLEKCNEIQHYLYEHYAIFHISQLIINDIYSIAVLAEIERKLEEVKEQSNRLPIGEFNKIISEKLKEQPAAFLYEKLGDRYQHFFIDEFQDTSVLQWKNLLPLVNNAVAGSGSSMIVGDGKQSIYRWRGGEVEQFLRLNNDEDHSNKILLNDTNVELYRREVVNLPKNWRSRKNIVDFNNSFFAATLQTIKNKNGDLCISNEMHRQLYEMASQEVQGKEGGYIEITRLPRIDSEEYKQAQGEECYRIICEAVKNGFNLSDIAILYRSNKSAGQLTTMLLQKGIQVISPDGLMLHQSSEVRALISFLKMIIRPDDKQATVAFLAFIWDTKTVIQSDFQERHVFLRENLSLKPEHFINKIKEYFPLFNYSRFNQSSLSEKLNLLCRWLKMEISSNPFLQKLLDESISYMQHNDDGIAGFLRWWEMEGSIKAIDMNPELDAVRLMSIHKAKGLEFPVVILAFADWQAFTERGGKTWLALNPELFFGLPAARVNFKILENEMPGMEDYCGLYEQNRANIALDNLNLLYVALTRAVDELYILGTQDWQDTQRITHYFNHYLNERGFEGERWKSGESKRAETASTPVTLNTVNYEWVNWQNRLRISSNNPKNWENPELTASDWGKKTHSILAELENAEMLESIISHQIEEGNFSAEEKQTLENLCRKVVEHPQLRPYFDGSGKVFNEYEIWMPSERSFRPDRLVKKKDIFHIIDYKTGIPSEMHALQIDNYAAIIQDMGFGVGDKILVYLNDPLEVVKW